MKELVTIKNPEDIFKLLKNWRNKRQENFLTITLNAHHDVIKVHHITKGLVNRTIVHPRECFYPAIKDYASAVVFVHNHPAGDCYPSAEDDDVTNTLAMTGSILGIKMLYHIIITKDAWFSCRKEKILKDDHGYQEQKQLVDRLVAERLREETMELEEKRIHAWNTLVDLHGEQILELITDYHGMQIINEGFIDHLVDEGIMEELE